MPETSTPIADKPTPAVHSTPAHLKLVAYRPESYAGISLDKSTNFHIFFTDDAPIVGFEGDQGLMKTSNLKCLEALLGGDEPKNAINDKDKKKKAELTYEDPATGDQYIGKITNSGFTVTILQKRGDSIVRSNAGEPKTLIRRLVGPIGISPMFLKEMKGKEQIEWIRGLQSFGDDQRKLEKDIETKYDTNFKLRTEANRQLKYLREDLLQSGYYSWDEKNSCLIPTENLANDKAEVEKAPANDDAINSKFQAANNANNNLIAARERVVSGQRDLKATEETITDLERQIRELQERLEKKLTEKGTIAANIENDKAFLQRTAATVEQEYKEAQEDMQNAGNIKLKRSKLEATGVKQTKFKAQEDEILRLNAILVECQKLQKDLVKSFTPEVDGLEIVVPGMTLDNGDKETRDEGIYYNNRTPQKMSESELWDFCLLMWHYFKVRIVIIENLQDLGTNAIERVNWFAANGGRVFYSAMERNIKETKVTYLTKVPV